MANEEIKIEKTFACREQLVEVFNKLSEEYECSIDYLINESMREYAKSRVTDSPTEMNGHAAIATPMPTLDEIEVVEVFESDAPEAAEESAIMLDDEKTCPPLPGPVSGVPRVPAGRPTLYLLFDGERHLVDKDEYIIGRGAKTADLAIRDGNISRRHAAIVFHDGEFFIKDLGSTNGVEFKGRRVESKRVEEGDVYNMCDYEIRFTYS